MANESTPPLQDARRINLVLAIATIALAAGALWFSRDMSIMASVFPRTIGALLLLFGVMLLIGAVMTHPQLERPATGHWPRRLSLIAIVLAWSLTLKWLGFLATSLAFSALLAVVAHFDHWSGRRILTYGATLLVIIAAFYGLFAWLLNVPLPAGRLWRVL